MRLRSLDISSRVAVRGRDECLRGVEAGYHAKEKGVKQTSVSDSLISHMKRRIRAL